MILRSALVALFLALAVVFAGSSAWAETVPAQTFTAPGYDAYPTNSLNLQTCTLQVSGTGSWTIVPQGSNDLGLTYGTVTTIGSGSIGTAGSFSGSIAGFAGTLFRFHVSAVSGSVNVVKTCTTQLLPSSGGGGGGSVTQGSSPWIDQLVAGSAVIGSVTQSGAWSFACTSGCSGGGGSFTPPYSAALGQTAQANSFLGSAGVYYATAPTLTNGQVNPLLVDQAGNAYVNLGASSGFGGAAGSPSATALTVQGIVNGQGIAVIPSCGTTSGTPCYGSVNTPAPANTDAASPAGVLFGYDGYVASGASPLPANLSQIAGSAIATGGTAGSQAVGGGAALGGSVASVNPVMAGCYAVTTALNGTSQANHTAQDANCDTYGNLFIRPGTSHPFSCSVTFASATTTQCAGAAASGLTWYITDLDAVGGSTQTAGTIHVTEGTGTNCGTTTTTVGNTYAIAAGAANFTRSFTMPIFNTAVTAPELCATTTGTTISLTVTMNGYVGP